MDAIVVILNFGKVECYTNKQERESWHMHYVYILKSVGKDWRYVGYTSDMRKRLDDHNQGKVLSTRNHRPFIMVSYIAVENKNIALNLEKYFKSGSGIAWMNKRLL